MDPVWRIPGVGAMHPCIDRVVIVSTAPVGTLMKFLPLPDLKRGFHSFDILTYDGPDPRLRSRIMAVGAGNEKVWQLLKKHEHRLRRVEDVQARLLALIARLDKRWHQRGHLHVISRPRDHMEMAPLVPTLVKARNQRKQPGLHVLNPTQPVLMLLEQLPHLFIPCTYRHDPGSQARIGPVIGENVEGVETPFQVRQWQ